MAAAMALVAPAGVSARSKTEATPAPAFAITMKAPGHHPKANRKWPVTVTAKTLEGEPLKGRLRYVFLYRGRVVSRQSNYKFTGRFTDRNFEWPSRAIGIPLTLRCQITTSLGIRFLDYAIRVRR